VEQQSQNLPASTTGTGTGNANDDYDIYSFDEGEDFFQDNATPHPLETQRIDPSASLEPISSSAIRLVQQSISRIKSSASSSGLFGVPASDEKNNAIETRGVFLSLSVSVSLCLSLSLSLSLSLCVCVSLSLSLSLSLSGLCLSVDPPFSNSWNL
jgi:hypothetical protein